LLYTAAISADAPTSDQPAAPSLDGAASAHHTLRHLQELVVAPPHAHPNGRNGARSFWDADAERYVEHRWEGTPEARSDAGETASFVFGCLQPNPGRVLDLGCGPGYWLHENPSFLGCDRSLPRLRQVPGPAGRRVAAGDWRRLPFAGETFDAVLLIHAIEYEHDKLATLLSEVKRVLRPGGRVVIVTKNPDGWPWRLARLLARLQARCPHPAVGRSANELAAAWNAAPCRVAYISSRLILSLRDVNDAAHGEAPAPVRRLALALATRMSPRLGTGVLARSLAWHVGVCFERQGQTERMMAAPEDSGTPAIAASAASAL